MMRRTQDESELRRQRDAFDGRLAGAAAFFHIAGNHDMTNLTQRKVWGERYGRRYSHFMYKGVLFLARDREDYRPPKMKAIYEQRAAYIAARKSNPATAQHPPYASLKESRTGKIGIEQGSDLEKVIRERANVRWTSILMHKPVYERNDDLGPQGIEAALGGRPFAVLNGHLHRPSYFERPSAAGAARAPTRRSPTFGSMACSTRRARYQLTAQRSASTLGRCPSSTRWRFPILCGNNNPHVRRRST
jgi:hypothetical protein